MSNLIARSLDMIINTFETLSLNLRHMNYGDMYGKELIEKPEIIDPNDEFSEYDKDRILYVVELSNCMICRFFRVKQYNILLCTHKNTNDCNSCCLTDANVHCSLEDPIYYELKVLKQWKQRGLTPKQMSIWNNIISLGSSIFDKGARLLNKLRSAWEKFASHNSGFLQDVLWFPQVFAISFITCTGIVVISTIITVGMVDSLTIVRNAPVLRKLIVFLFLLFVYAPYLLKRCRPIFNERRIEFYVVDDDGTATKLSDCSICNFMRFILLLMVSLTFAWAGINYGLGLAKFFSPL